MPVWLRIGLIALPTALTAQAPPRPLPLKFVGPPTTPAITAGDLMTRLYAFADDSMMGRVIGTEHNNRATAYIEREVRRLGLVPAGDGGEYFQYLPLHVRSLDSTSTMTVGDDVFRVAVDFIGASAVSSPRQFRGEATIYGGMVLDTANVLTPEMTRGKIVLLRNFAPQRGQTQAQLNAMQQTPAAQSYFRAIEAAAGTIFIGPDAFGPQAVRAALNPITSMLVSAFRSCSSQPVGTPTIINSPTNRSPSTTTTWRA